MPSLPDRVSCLDYTHSVRKAVSGLHFARWPRPATPTWAKECTPATMKATKSSEQREKPSLLLHEHRHRRTGAHQVAVAVGIIDASDARPEFPGAHEGQRIRRLMARIGMRPFVRRHRRRGVRGVLQDVVLFIRLAVDDGLNFGANRDHGIAEAVELFLRFALCRLDHDRTWDGEAYRGRVETIVH